MKPVNRDKLEVVLDEIMDSFDFEKVHTVMTMLDWHWVDCDGNGRVPSVDQIRDKAAELLWEVCCNDEDAASIGGLDAEKDFSDPEDPFVSLSFVLTNYNVSYDEVFLCSALNE